MLTKFIRDKNGLQLQIEASNDAERALIAEMVKASPYRPRGVKLYVFKDISTDGIVNKISVINGGFINASILRSYRFKNDRSPNSETFRSMYRRVGDTLLLITGTSTYNIYTVAITPNSSSFVIDCSTGTIMIDEYDIDGTKLNSYSIKLTNKSIKVRNAFELDMQMQKLVDKYTIDAAEKPDKKE